jgi:SAM-dependent methyltransferase
MDLFKKVGDHLPGLLTSDSYIRERLDPRPGDSLYLHLSDLLLAMQRFATDEPLRILDLGCGGSPYRSLFPRATYERADVDGALGIDYTIPLDGSSFQLAVDDASFDIILSTQVLEHVAAPDAYLREARRVLRHGGRLILSTHGMFQDHGCPFDFRRWTSDGLRLDLETSGFKVKQMLKLTTGPRATMFLLQQHGYHPSRKTSLGRRLWWLNRMLSNNRASFDRQCDAALQDRRVVSDDLEKHPIYIALLAVAELKSDNS